MDMKEGRELPENPDRLYTLAGRSGLVRPSQGDTMATSVKKQVAEKMARSRMARRGKELTQKNWHSAISGGTAYVMGLGERRGWDFPTVPKVDPKLVYGVGALAISTMVRGEQAKRVTRSMGDGLIGAWAYSAGKSGDFGVGDEGMEEDDAEI